MKYHIQGQDYSAESLIEKAADMFGSADIALWEKSIWQCIADWMNPHLESLEMKTSGSTGLPKAIQVPKKYIEASALNTIAYFQLAPGACLHLCMNAAYVGAKMMIIRALLGEMQLSYEEASSNALVNIKHPVDFCAAVPLQVHELLEKMPAGNPHIKQLIIGGASIDRTIIEALQQHETKYYQTFGMTETISHIAVRALNPFEEAYTCLPAISVTADPTDDSMIIEAPNLGLRKFACNDIIRSKDAKHFEWLGRKDFVINSGGIKIHPEQVEFLIKPFMQQAFYVSARTDARLGAQLVLVVEGKLMEDSATLLAKLKSVLPLFQVPKSIMEQACFAYTETGKLKRK